jgi:hypothetical protein
MTPERILRLWEADHPRAVQAMRKAGALERELQSADDIAAEAYGDALESGLNPDQAWELERAAVRDLPTAWRAGGPSPGSELSAATVPALSARTWREPRSRAEAATEAKVLGEQTVANINRKQALQAKSPAM